MGKCKEWLKRYGPAEIVGTATALGGAWLGPEIVEAAGFSSQVAQDIATAYGGTVGENIGYYGTIIGREVTNDWKAAVHHRGRYDLGDAVKTGRNLLLEFGPAEALDSLLVRPLAMGLGAKLLGKGWGIPVGKVVADISFYLPAITSYEIRKRLFPD